MSGMQIFVTIIHVLLAVFMIFVILLQPGKDAGMGAAFGGGAATSAFGGRGAVTFLSKLTAVCAGLFFLTSLGLSFVGMGSSVAGRFAPTQTEAAPAVPGTVEGAEGGQGAAPPAGEGVPSGSPPLPLETAPPTPAQEMGDVAPSGTNEAAPPQRPTVPSP